MVKGARESEGCAVGWAERVSGGKAKPLGQGIGGLRRGSTLLAEPKAEVGGRAKR